MLGYWKWIIGTAIAAGMMLLTACSRTDDASYFLQHPKKMAAVVKQCEQQNHLTGDRAQRCQVVKQLAQTLQALKLEAMLNSEVFGQRILAAQSRLAQLKQMQVPLKGQQQEEYRRLQQQLANRLAAIRLIN